MTATKAAIQTTSHVPSTTVPVFLLGWFFLYLAVLMFSETGHGELDVSELVFGALFFVTYPIFTLWLLIQSALHLKNYRFNAVASESSYSRVYLWCGAAALYLIGAGAFVALEVFGLEAHLAGWG